MLNVRLACDHLFGKLLFTWLSLVMSMMVSFVLSFFPRDVLDEILNLIESVSEDFPSYSWINIAALHCHRYDVFGDNTDIFCRNKTQSINLLTLNQINIASMNGHGNDVFRDKRDIFCRNETPNINLLTLNHTAIRHQRSK